MSKRKSRRYTHRRSHAAHRRTRNRLALGGNPPPDPDPVTKAIKQFRILGKELAKLDFRCKFYEYLDGKQYTTAFRPTCDKIVNTLPFKDENISTWASFKPYDHVYYYNDLDKHEGHVVKIESTLATIRTGTSDEQTEVTEVKKLRHAIWDLTNSKYYCWTLVSEDEEDRIISANITKENYETELQFDADVLVVTNSTIKYNDTVLCEFADSTDQFTVPTDMLLLPNLFNDESLPRAYHKFVPFIFKILTRLCNVLRKNRMVLSDMSNGTSGLLKGLPLGIVMPFMPSSLGGSYYSRRGFVPGFFGEQCTRSSCYTLIQTEEGIIAAAPPCNGGSLTVCKKLCDTEPTNVATATRWQKCIDQCEINCAEPSAKKQKTTGAGNMRLRRHRNTRKKARQRQARRDPCR